MSKNYIEKFVHKQGLHCGSTAMSNFFNYYGISLSEELCFGLGSGIGFGYYIFPELNPPVYITGRINDLEIFLCNNLNIEISLEANSDFDAVYNILKNKIDRKEPVIIWVDTYYLPYFKSPYHFSVHRVILIGYDEEYVYIADNEREEIQKVSFSDFKKARTEGNFPIPTENRYYEIKINKNLKPLELATRDALSKTCEIMLYSEEENNGIKGINKMAEDLLKWEEKLGENWKEAAKTVYLISEKFGTGGGNFRNIYAKFLREIAEKIKNKKIEEAAEEMGKVAKLWEEAMSHLKESSKEENFTKIKKVSKILKIIAENEKKIYTELKEATNE
jgi:hypothetical protein